MKVALVGLGMVAGTHLRAIAECERVQLAGVCSRDVDKAAAWADAAATELGESPRVYPDVAAIAADPTVDFVVLCTPPNARHALVTALVEAGKPILMEKPVERDLEAATGIVELCEARSVPLGIVFQHRMREASIAARTLLAEGSLGPLAAVEITVPWWREQSYYDEPGRGSYARDGGGVLISQAIHTLDLALCLTGPVAGVQAMARTTGLHDMESEDFVCAGLEFDSGAVGSLVASTASRPGAAESIRLHGPNGSATLVSGTLEIVWQDGRTETRGAVSGTGGGSDPMAFTHAWHQAVLEDFVDALASGRAPECSGRDALRVHALIEALIESSRRKCQVSLS